MHTPIGRCAKAQTVNSNLLYIAIAIETFHIRHPSHVRSPDLNDQSRIELALEIGLFDKHGLFSHIVAGWQGARSTANRSLLLKVGSDVHRPGVGKLLVDTDIEAFDVQTG